MTLMTRTALKALAPLALVGALAACDNNDNDAGAPPIVIDRPPPPPTTYDVSACLNQTIPGTGGVTVAGAVIPDTLTLNFGAASGFPNGRRLTDPVIDVTLAAVFLDLSVEGATAFAEVPLNPPGNDVSFRQGFPYLAPPQGSPPASSSAGTVFAFDMSPDSAYDRVDRMGMPAVSTALIPTDTKVAYNDASPADDVDGDFADDITMVLTDLTNALADDLLRAGFTPCATPNS